MNDTYPYYLANTPVYANADLDVINKFTQEVACCVGVAGADVVDEAICKAVEAFEILRRWPTYRRRDVLEQLMHGIETRHEELAKVLVVEVGKPIAMARGEVDRCLDTIRNAMEESTRVYGEWMPLDVTPRGEGYQAIWKRVPIGPCSFIVPFNFPLNLMTHKICPALAVGCSFVLKPDPRTPVSALIVGEILSETDLPPGAFSILPVLEDGLAMFSEDDRFKLLSFTGSPQVGWKLKTKAGRKKVALELGGNAACIVDHDADLEFAAQRIVAGAYGLSGQSCISVQRILAHRQVHDELLTLIEVKANALNSGDPMLADTNLGPMISEADAKRVESWVDEAVARGAHVLCGGAREGLFYQPTLLANVPHDAEVSCREVFGPVAMIEPFDEFEDALRIANDSEFGLQVGVFTNDLNKAYLAFEELEVGGVIINDIPSMRVDAMPYGGVKASGLGREGVRFAIEDMTERRLMVLNQAGMPKQ
ncbi:MAG: aldehyde dehydrogenase family protein [Planctomycetota bacterium]|nr:aldehyde dehydrogenase family protein [Planctomycetota bacterium]